MKARYLLLTILLMLTGLITACTPDSPPEMPPTQTPDVPPIADITSAINRWERGNNQRYFVEVEETTRENTFLYRVVVADGEIRAAQRLERVDGNWQPPAALDHETAADYTVDALLDRILKDASGQGPAPMDMFAVFDGLSGFPTVVEATALQTITEEGKVRLNREHSYTLSVNVGLLIEDTTGLTKDPILTIYRSGGPEALCSTLRIFDDGSSIFSDDCRQTLLQIRPPREEMVTLEELADMYGSFEALQEDEYARLVFEGDGSNEPDAATKDELWAIALDLDELLSQPIGAGLTLIYKAGEELFGFDMRTNLAQPASIESRPPMHGIITDPAGQYLLFADDNGLRAIDTTTGDTSSLFSNPPDLHYEPLGWTGSGEIILLRLPDTGTGAPEWGWASLAENSWHPIPVPVEGTRCESGFAADPVGKQFVIAVSAEEDCALQPGLWLGDIRSDELTSLVSGGVESVAWSPDGTQLAFIQTDEDGAPALYLISEDGTGLSAAEGTKGAQSPTWSADSTTVYYGNMDGIQAYDLNTGTLTLEIPGEGLLPLGISPDGLFMAYRTPAGISSWNFEFQQAIAVTFSGEDTHLVGWLDALAGRE